MNGMGRQSPALAMRSSLLILSAAAAVAFVCEVVQIGFFLHLDSHGYGVPWAHYARVVSTCVFCLYVVGASLTARRAIMFAAVNDGNGEREEQIALACLAPAVRFIRSISLGTAYFMAGLIAFAVVAGALEQTVGPKRQLLNWQHTSDEQHVGQGSP